jgi:predicted nucleic acid-binding protein
LSACVLDTDVVIAGLDRSDAHHAEAVVVFERLAADRFDLYLSTVNYAEALVRPAKDEQMLRTAMRAITALGISLVAPDGASALAAARYRNLGISLADGFALATAKRHGTSVASFDKRVRRALGPAGLELCPALG